jgi:hypothetical protein
VKRGWCLVVLAISAAGCRPEPELTYQERRAGFQTTLTNPGKVPPGGGYTGADLYPGDWEALAAGIEELRYPSEDLELRAWIYVPQEARERPAPALVYLHPGSEGTAQTIRQGKPFIDAGFVVMVPTFRGAPGNPGHFELQFGEVDDAAAAARWLAGQPFVNPERVYAFGWSSGGAVAALLSLLDEVPVVHTGSCGGLAWGPHFKEIAPFDPADPMELEMRSLVGNIRWMQRRHYAFVGSGDQSHVPYVAAAQQEIGERESLLQISMLPGDHFTSAQAAIEGYLEVIREE